MKCLYYQDFTESLSVCISLQKEHNPPHIHAIYGDDMAAITIADGKILEGALPYKALELVREWISLHKDELLAIWETQDFKHLPPLE